MQKAVFLDRDGVLNHELDRYVCTLNEFEVLPDVPKALKIMQDNGFLLIVVTNQGGIAQDWYSHETLHKMHQQLQAELNKVGVQLTEIYYSPQHVQHTGKSLCRKPGSLMLEKALARFDINPSISYMIGDKPTDVQAAESVGIKGILIEPDQSLLSILNLLV